MTPYLSASAVIDFDHPRVAALAAELKAGAADESSLVRRCYEFVRDRISHSWDVRRGPVTCQASDVLLHGTGFCYAKSHLLAALLRANGIPAGLCYQRLSLVGTGAPYCLHGLNAVYLRAHGWYRLDPRGNKPGVAAAFCPPTEALAFAVRDPQECDFPEIWPEPFPVVVRALATATDIEFLYAHLPDRPPLPVGRASRRAAVLPEVFRNPCA
jgi:transglutaminase-like putative cysteine protease